MSNPFENSDAQYLVLVNDELQHSLWPSDAAVPAGWSVALSATSRQACLDHVEEHWSDIRPQSVAAATATS
ncbi:MbtH family protein [Streptomyces sp. NPDC007095]|jgi:MbtH protein|uniref:MbtH family protein n=1 Tax=Streptomyces sp. NPDC007095 TaxID=3154482 RepID=UPI000C705C8A